MHADFTTFIIFQFSNQTQQKITLWKVLARRLCIPAEAIGSIGGVA